MKIILAIAIALSVFPGTVDSQTNTASGPSGRNKPRATPTTASEFLKQHWQRGSRIDESRYARLFS